jgi:glucose-1-phosphate adenylyltransferase
VQQNFTFIKNGEPDLILILSGDHIYTMDYDAMIAFHLDQQADVTVATIRVPKEEASRFGIVAMNKKYQVKSFVEKPESPPSNLANMGVYVFNRAVLDRALWEDHNNRVSNHDFGKNIIPKLVASNARVFAFPYTGYWMDVGTVASYWQSHMDLLSPNPPIKLYDRRWVIHTRTEERPPVRFPANGSVFASMITDGCFIEDGARVESSVLSPGVIVRPGALIRESILLTDCVVEKGAVIERAILDKRVRVGENARIGGGVSNTDIRLALAGKNTLIPAGCVVEPGAEISTDVVETDYDESSVRAGQSIKTKRKIHEV